MDALSAIQNRRATKRFVTEPLPQDALQKLLEAAYDAPSGANRHPRQYVVVTAREDLDRLAGLHAYCTWFRSAQAALAVLGDSIKSRYWLEDCCVAAENVWLAATAIGLGVGWAAIYQSDDAQETARREDMVREILGVPGTLRVPLLLGVGYPAGAPPARKRPPLAAMVHWGRFGTADSSVTYTLS
ncbi:MAG: nitroreductase family protein [Chloroflexi bacterium]|nr:nitroreductase family protein [Chloroflexota bacterium]